MSFHDYDFTSSEQHHHLQLDMDGEDYGDSNYHDGVVDSDGDFLDASSFAAAGSIASHNFNVGCGGFMPSLRRCSSLRGTCGPVLGLGRNRQTVLSSQNKADFGALELELGQTKFPTEGQKKRRIEPWCFPVSIVGILILLIILLPLFNQDDKASEALKNRMKQLCTDPCRLSLVESLETSSSPNHPASNFSTSLLAQLIQSAYSSLDIAGPFSPTHPPSKQLIDTLRETANLRRNLKIRLVQPLHVTGKVKSSRLFDPWSTVGSSLYVRSLDVSRWMQLQSDYSSAFPPVKVAVEFNINLWIVDKRDFYLAHPSALFSSSSNLLYSGYAGGAEKGDLVSEGGGGYQLELTAVNCSCLTEDLSKLFGAYWLLAGLPAGSSSQSAAMKPIFPSAAVTGFNRSFPLLVPYNGDPVPTQVFFSVSPSFLELAGRCSSLDALLSTLNEANEFIHIHVTDYSPRLSVEHVTGSRIIMSYWPLIDNAIREAAIGRNVRVKLLVNKCAARETPAWTLSHLQSLQALAGLLTHAIEIRWFVTDTHPPAVNSSISQQRDSETVYGDAREEGRCGNRHGVNYVVTDTGAHWGTSAWQGDQLLSNFGMSMSFFPQHRHPTENRDASTINGFNTKSETNSSSQNWRQMNSLFLDQTITPLTQTLYAPSITQQLESIFQRNWNSTKALPLSPLHSN